MPDILYPWIKELTHEELELIIENEFPSETLLKSCVLLKGGVINTTYLLGLEKSTPGEDWNREVVLRVAPFGDLREMHFERNRMQHEVQVLEIMRQTFLPVPEVISHRKAGEVIQREYMLMDKIPGYSMGKALKTHDSSWRGSVDEKLGGIVRTMHDITPPPELVWNGWPQQFRIFLQEIVSDLMDIKAVSEHEALRLLDLVEKGVSMLHDDVPSLLHLDLWVENILVDGDAVTGIIDADRAMWGGRDFELAILEHYGMASEAFYRGYGPYSKDAEDWERTKAFYLSFCQMENLYHEKIGLFGYTEGYEKCREKFWDFVDHLETELGR